MAVAHFYWGAGVGFLLIILAIIVLSTVFWIWMLVDAITNPKIKDPVIRVLWFLLIFFTHFFGALLYFLFGRG